MNPDISIVQYLYTATNQNEFARLVYFFADTYSYSLILLFIIVMIWDFARRRNGRMYLLAVVAALITRSLLPVFHYLIPRDRPFVALQLDPLIYEPSSSFPSGHTIFIIALATAVYYFNRPLAYFLYASGLIVGLARVAAGVHYPSDIVGAIVLGIGVTIGVWCLMTSSGLVKRGQTKK